MEEDRKDKKKNKIIITDEVFKDFEKQFGIKIPKDGKFVASKVSCDVEGCSKKAIAQCECGNKLYCSSACRKVDFPKHKKSCTACK